MPLDRDNGLLLVHIPKTGGTSITTALFPTEGRTKHLLAGDYDVADWEEAFTFAFVRDPYDRLLSSYRYHVRGGYQGFFAQHYPGLCDMSFGDYLRTFVLPLRDPDAPGHPNFFSQARFVRHPKSEKPIDFIGRFEHLERDFSELLSRIGRGAELPHQLRTRQRDSVTLAAVEKEIIESVYAEDFETFGYPIRSSVQIVVPEEPRPEGLRLAIGCRWKQDGWKTLARGPREGSDTSPADVSQDPMVESALPLDSNSVQSVYLANTLESLDDERARALFSEILRVLRPGGVLRVTALDMEFIAHAFRRGDRSLFERFRYKGGFADISTPQAFVHCFAAVRAQHVDFELCEKLSDEEVYHLMLSNDDEQALERMVAPIPKTRAHARYPWHPLNWWTSSKLHRELSTSGFAHVIHQRFNSCLDVAMTNRKHFDQSRPWASLFIDAVKRRTGRDTLQ